MTDWLTEALEAHRPAEYPWRDDAPNSEDVVEGDIVVIGSMDGRGPADLIVLAFEVDPETRSFMGLLVTNEVALACGGDLVLDSEETGLPYRTAVMTHFSSRLWNVQIKRRVGVLTDEALDAVSASRYGVEHEFQQSRRGLPLQNETRDMRWPDLRAGLDHLQALAQDCTSNWNQDIGLPFADPRLLTGLTAVPFPDEETFERMVQGTRGFSPGCSAWAINNLNNQQLRAYRPLLSARGRPADSPLPDDCHLPYSAEDDAAKSLLRITAADALEEGPLVKIAVLDGGEELRSSRFTYRDRPAEHWLVKI